MKHSSCRQLAWWSAVATLVLGGFGSASSTNNSAEQYPNIVILLADNLGYEDVSLFSTTSDKVTTPNIDALGRQGMMFTHWNSAAALCSASRAALLTGKYPVRTGVYPRVFKPDATEGLSPDEVTLAEALPDVYKKAIVGKWHLGHLPAFLPTQQGFDSWLGIPYHMSGGSVDGHVCNQNTKDGTENDDIWWLPLYANETIVEQPVRLDTLAGKYAQQATSFIQDAVYESNRPFFLFMSFSHVHQLCAPKDIPEPQACQWSAKEKTFASAVAEMDWIAGQILSTLRDTGAENNTLVLFTSDNGPWVAEQSCAGKKGPFQGQWLKDNGDPSCTACPHDYVPAPIDGRPHRCMLPRSSSIDVDGVPCGEDTGLGSVWEANLRMPTIVRFPGVVPAGSFSDALLSTLDVYPTIMSMLDLPVPDYLDGRDFSEILRADEPNWGDEDSRALFFWRDGFEDGPLPQPYGRFDVAATKLGRFKAWFYTKSAHYNEDKEVYHDPPLLFDVLEDPAEARPLSPVIPEYAAVLEKIRELTLEHKESIEWTEPLCLPTDPSSVPCVDQTSNCRTKPIWKYHEGTTLGEFE